MSLPGGLDVGDAQPPRAGAGLLLVGLVLLVIGVGGVAYGIGQAIGQAGAIRDDAVAEGVVREAPGEPIAFESPKPGLSVYLDFDGITSNSEVFDDATGATVCAISGDGFELSVRGSRQGTAATIGDLSSVGSFDLPARAARISCGYDRLQGRFRRPAEVPFLVTPHKTSEVAKSVLIIIGAVGVAGVGGWAAVVGWLRRRKRARLERL